MNTQINQAQSCWIQNGSLWFRGLCTALVVVSIIKEKIPKMCMSCLSKCMLYFILFILYAGCYKTVHSLLKVYFTPQSNRSIWKLICKNQKPSSFVSLFIITLCSTFVYNKSMNFWLCCCISIYSYSKCVFSTLCKWARSNEKAPVSTQQ